MSLPLALGLIVTLGSSLLLAFTAKYIGRGMHASMVAGGLGSLSLGISIIASQVIPAGVIRDVTHLAFVAGCVFFTVRSAMLQRRESRKRQSS